MSTKIYKLECTFTDDFEGKKDPIDNTSLEYTNASMKTELRRLLKERNLTIKTLKLTKEVKE